jgi:hypothetical protein
MPRVGCATSLEPESFFKAACGRRFLCSSNSLFLTTTARWDSGTDGICPMSQTIEGEKSPRIKAFEYADGTVGTVGTSGLGQNGSSSVSFAAAFQRGVVLGHRAPTGLLSVVSCWTPALLALRLRGVYIDLNRQFSLQQCAWRPGRRRCQRLTT